MASGSDRGPRGDMLNELSAVMPADVTTLAHLDSHASADPTDEPLDCLTSGFALQDGECEAYNEDAFQYFLEVERKRCEPSNRPLLLVLIELRRSSATTRDE